MMSIDSETLRVGRDRITRVFRYLEALNQHRNPAKRQIGEQAWVLWFHDLPDHPSIRRGIVAQSADAAPETTTKPRSDEEKTGDDFVLKVRRPSPTHAPTPPELIIEWLEAGWENPFGEAHIRESRNEIDSQGETRLVRFDDDTHRVQALQSWMARRIEWARNERPTRLAIRIFEKLYELHGQVEREAERVELVLGDGILSWLRPEGGVYHPVLLQRLQLEFNPSVPEFTLFETEHAVELYSALFRSMPDIEGRAIARCREELEQGDYHPLGDAATSGFLKRLVVQLSSRGEFSGEKAPEGETENPRIGRDPVVFLRTRTLGFATAIEGVLENINHREDFPKSLLNVVGLEAPSQEDDGDMTPSIPSSDSEDILLSKHTNPEQIWIAERLEHHGSVLVQGPPGTGKTHTIANLIGHLLAQGKTVLVTSHTTKALRVVREHVVEKLRPLCVSVLERDIDSRRQLQSSVEAIVERLSTSDEQQLQAEAISIAKQRRELRSKLHQAQQDLKNARGDEYRDVIIAGQGYPPSDAARKVTAERGMNDWIPRPVVPGMTLPLSEGELIDLYRTNAILSTEDEVELAQTLPDPNDLKTSEDFEQMVKEREHLTNLDLDFRSELWDFPPNEESLKELESITEHLCQAVEPIAVGDAWKLAAIAAGLSGGPNREPWDNLLSKINTVCNEAATAQETLVRHAPTLSDKISFEEYGRILEEILPHVRSGGKLGRLTFLRHRSWKRLIQETTVAGRQPHLVEHFRALMVLARLKISRYELAGRWDRQMSTLGAPSSMQFGDEPERACAQFSPQLSHCLGWYRNEWEPLERDLKSLGFCWETFLGEQPPNLAPHGELLRLREAVITNLPEILSARANAVRWHRLEAEIDALTRKLAFASSGTTSSHVVNRLRESVTNLDANAYRKAFQRLVDLHNLRSNYDRRRELLARLEEVAPAWSAAIRDRYGCHNSRDIPGNAAAAWLWRQLHDELEKRGQVVLEELQQTIIHLSEDLQQMTAELIDRRSWAAQVKRTTLYQRQALIGWLDTIRKIGKGYGKRVPRLRREAARKMSDCRTAVPVWVMPLARAVENFDPQTTRFDVVNIDEASQSDVMGLLAFYLARKVVVVGDHEQVSPAAVGQDVLTVQHLIDEHLRGIPNRELYDGQMSIYDLAHQSFGGTICLLEHFRCVPEIIQFSNQLSYDGRIKPLRDPSFVQLKPHLIAYRANNSQSDNKVNREEAWIVASLLAAALEQPEYKGKTFGVISLVGVEQAQEIERILLRHIPPEDYQDRRILCGNAAHFQGDERDVMFLSMVDTSSGNGPLPLREQQMFRQRFNVAASRARDQMWVVHSLDSKNDLKPGDLRKRLIEHAENPLVLLRAMKKGEQRVQSEFERAVLRRLIQAGYRVIPQWRVGYYWIDLVVEGGGKRLAIECDGDRFHPIDKLEEDMARQAIIERLGWTFSRIRGSHFFRDADAAMKPIFQRLEALEIPPEGNEPSSDKKPDSLSSELKDRVIRRADELRRRWQEARSAEGEEVIEPAEEEKQTEAGQENPPEQPEVIIPRPVQETVVDNSHKETAQVAQDSDEVEWAHKIGPSNLRRLYRWAKEKGGFSDSEVKSTYWVAENIAKKKKISPTDARKAKRIYERAVNRGFSV